MKKHLAKDIEALIVEDEIDICFFLKVILKKKNLQSACVNNLHEAKDVLAVQHPSIVFLDNNLPDGYGIDFIQAIKNNDPLIIIIIITADDTLSNRDKALNAGADFFIGKPFTMDAINRMIDSVVSNGVN